MGVYGLKTCDQRRRNGEESGDQKEEDQTSLELLTDIGSPKQHHEVAIMRGMGPPLTGYRRSLPKVWIQLLATYEVERKDD